MHQLGEAAKVIAIVLTLLAAMFTVCGIIVFFWGSVGEHDGRCGNGSSDSPCRSAWMDV